MGLTDRLYTLVAKISDHWTDIKSYIEHSIGFSHDALHVLIGVAMQIGLAALFRTSVARIWPWAVVLVLELANEWNDFHVEIWSDAAMQWGESTKDVLLTMALPTLLLLVARYRPQWLSGR